MDKIFTRKALRELAKSAEIDLPKDLENEIINMHLESRDAYAESAVNTALEENKPDEKSIKETETYKNLKMEFENYKNAQNEKEAKTAKESAVRAYFEDKNITGQNLELAIRASEKEINALEIEGGKIKDTKDLDTLVTGVLAGLATKSRETGTATPNPPNKQTLPPKINKEDFAKMGYKERVDLYTKDKALYTELTE